MDFKDQVQLAKSELANTFYKKHKGDNPLKLLLRYNNAEDKKWLASQLAHRAKHLKKLPEWSAHSSIIFPPQLSLEQSSSELTAKLKASIFKGETLTDATAGMGIDAYYLSKQFGKTLAFERNMALAQITKHNLKELSSNTDVLAKAFNLGEINHEVDLLYTDPARRGADNEKLVGLETCEPNVLEWIPVVFEKAKTLAVKASPMLDIALAIKQLKQLVSEVWVISVKNECKELVFTCTENVCNNPNLKLFNYNNNRWNLFESSIDETKRSCSIATGVDLYVYEPNASVQKAMAGDAAAKKFDLAKLHPFTNLYTTNKKVDDYPGKVFEVKEVHKPYSKTLRKKQFNIVSRNFFDKASFIEKKLQSKPGTANYLLACTLAQTNGADKPVFIEAQLVN